MLDHGRWRVRLCLAFAFSGNLRRFRDQAKLLLTATGHRLLVAGRNRHGLQVRDDQVLVHQVILRFNRLIRIFHRANIVATLLELVTQRALVHWEARRVTALLLRSEMATAERRHVTGHARLAWQSLSALRPEEVDVFLKGVLQGHEGIEFHRGDSARRVLWAVRLVEAAIAI